MKSKYLITGVLASSLVLSATAMNQVKKVGDTEDKLKETSVSVSNYVQENKTQLLETAPVAQETASGQETVSIELTEEMLSETVKEFHKAEPVEVQILSSAVDYDTFYSQHGYDKEATVFYNGETLPFTDVFPIIERGTTFVPLVVLADRIGATTEYIAETHSVSLVYRGDVITFDIDDTKYYVNGGEAQELPYATFTVNKRTMVPLRFVTDAFGLDIYWNDQYRQVMVADLDGLKANIGDNYSIMDGLLTFTNNDSQGQNAKLSGDFVVEVQEDEDVATMTGDLSVLANYDMSALDYKMNFALDLSPFQSSIESILSLLTETEDSAALTQDLLDSLATFNLNYIYDLDNMMIYMQTDLVTELFPVLSTAALDASIDRDTWFQLAVTDFMLDSELDLMQSTMNQFAGETAVTSVDQLVDFMMEMTRYENNNNINIYGAVEDLLTYASDDCFVVEDGTGTLSYVKNQDNRSAYLDLTVDMTEGVVSGYEVEVRYVDADTVTFSLSQETSDTLSVAMTGQTGSFFLDASGDFVVEFTEERASNAPQSENRYDMSALLS